MSLSAGGLTKQKRLGAYYTPLHLARYLVRWAIRTPRDSVVEPACGDAVFLQAAEERYAELGGAEPPARIIGFELDADAAASALARVPAATIVVGDFFDQEPLAEPVDAIVGNPPYVRYHHFAGAARERGLARALKANVTLTGLASSWAPFVVHATSFLKPEGRLALVLPAELLGTEYAAPVRELLLRRFETVDVITFDTRVFPGAMIDAVLLLADGRGPGRLRVHRLPDDSKLREFTPSGLGDQAAARWTGGLLGDDSAEALAAAADVMPTLGDLASVDIGIVTGANSFFVLTDEEAGARGLGPSLLRRAVARARQMRGCVLTAEAWEQERRGGAPVWLFAPDARQGSAANYIATGESAGVNSAYKCKGSSKYKFPPFLGPALGSAPTKGEVDS